MPHFHRVFASFLSKVFPREEGSGGRDVAQWATPLTLPYHSNRAGAIGADAIDKR